MATTTLQPFYQTNTLLREIGVDEAGRGPLFGRVYSAAVVLPRHHEFDFSIIKDSKKFHSKRKIQQAYDYIIKNAFDYGIGYADEKLIDKINILQATQIAMHNAIRNLKNINITDNDYIILVDGNYFKHIPRLIDDNITYTPYVCIEGGDNKIVSIAAASILAKVERDKYILELCDQNPTLVEYYGLDTNKGYGTAQHLNGIRKYGRTEMHRQSFKIGSRGFICDGDNSVDNDVVGNSDNDNNDNNTNTNNSR